MQFMPCFNAAECCLAATITFSVTDALYLQALISVFTALVPTIVTAAA